MPRAYLTILFEAELDEVELAELLPFCKSSNGRRSRCKTVPKLLQVLVAASSRHLPTIGTVYILDPTRRGGGRRRRLKKRHAVQRQDVFSAL